MTTIAEGYAKARVKLAGRANRILPDTCRLIVGEDEYEGVACKLRGGSGNVDGAPYRIKFAWGSPSVVGAAVVMDAIAGRSQLTLQLVAPADSSTDLFHEWHATSGPGHGRADVGF